MISPFFAPAADRESRDGYAQAVVRLRDAVAMRCQAEVDLEKARRLEQKAIDELEDAVNKVVTSVTAKKTGGAT